MVDHLDKIESIEERIQFLKTQTSINSPPSLFDLLARMLVNEQDRISWEELYEHEFMKELQKMK